MMRKTAMAISMVALVMTIVPPCLFLAGSMTLAATKAWLAAMTLVWFVATPLWMERAK